MIPQFSSKIISIEQYTHDVFFVTFEKPDSFSYKAGQYIQFLLPDGTKRSYSLSSTPSSDYLSCCIKRIEDGKASRYICDLQKGDSISFFGPIGHFVLRPTAHHVFIATGVGISPIIGMISELIEKKNPGSINLLFGLRNNKDLFLENIIEKWSKLHPRFTGRITLSQPSPDVTNNHLIGRVTHHIHDVYLPSDTTYYLCGSREMVIDVRKKLLELGVSSTDIAFEIF